MSNNTNNGQQASTPYRNSPNLNNQAGRVSPKSGGGRRSPNFYERTTTVRLVQPSTGKLVCTKLNRVQRTRCRVENGSCLCENFLNGHCDHGSSCQLAHVPRQYLWDFLTPHVNRTTMIYDEGFNIRCYTPNMDRYYDIPSCYVYVTHGSEKYVELFNDNGDNFKEKFKLCEVLVSKGYCEAGTECGEVHCCTADMSGFPCIRTHIAEAEVVGNYERLPASVTVRVFQPNSGDEGQDFPGDDVLRTAGATQYEEECAKGGGAIPCIKMQHCAHFQNKKLCRLGDGCRFLHVVSVALATPLAGEESNGSPQSVSPLNTPALGSQMGSNKNSAAFMAVAGMMNSANQSSTSIIPAGGNQQHMDGSPRPNMAAERISPVRRHNPYSMQ